MQASLDRCRANHLDSERTRLLKDVARSQIQASLNALGTTKGATSRHVGRRIVAGEGEKGAHRASLPRGPNVKGIEGPGSPPRLRSSALQDREYVELAEGHELSRTINKCGSSLDRLCSKLETAESRIAERPPSLNLELHNDIRVIPRAEGGQQEERYRNDHVVLGVLDGCSWKELDSLSELIGSAEFSELRTHFARRSDMHRHLPLLTDIALKDDATFRRAMWGIPQTGLRVDTGMVFSGAGRPRHLQPRPAAISTSTTGTATRRVLRPVKSAIM